MTSPTTIIGTSRHTGAAPEREEIDLRRLAGAAVIAALGSALANSLVRVAAVEAFDIPHEFEPLTAVAPVQASIVVAVGAAVVLGLLARFSRRPTWLFRRVALAVFGLSFIPLIPMYLSDPPQFPGTDAASVGSLALMHVVSVVIVVPVLTALSRRPASR